MFLRWHSWYAHVVFNSSLRQLANLSLQSIGLCRARLGGKVASPMLCILVSQKLVLVKVVTVHIPIIGRWIIKDGGENWYTQIQWNVMNKPHIVLCERIWPWMLLLISHESPLWVWRLETVELFISFFLVLACRQAILFFFWTHQAIPKFLTDEAKQARRRQAKQR